jgi:hypothetical protein
MGLMSNMRLINLNEDYRIRIAQRDILETDDKGRITLTHVPIDSWIFVYNKETGEKLTNLSFVDEKVLQTPLVYTDVIVDYEYNYTKSYTTLAVGRALTDGYLSFTAKTRIKDDVTGQVKTGIINIPKLKLMSDLSMVLGENAAPQMGKFNAVAIPVGNKGSQVVMEFIMLDDDIDSDM